MTSELLLLSGNDIPFPQARLTIHQPTIKEIAYIGEEALFLGYEFLNFSKENLSEADKSNLATLSDFEILMSMINDKSPIVQQNKVYTLLLLSLLFPNYSLGIQKDGFIFTDVNNEDEQYQINADTFGLFKEILTEMFCLKQSDGDDYNTVTKRGREIAEKLKQGRSKAAQSKGESQKIALLSRYISILAVGESKSINDLLNYTVYQLFDEFTRFELKQSFDMYMSAKFAGATGLEEVDNWMKDIHV